MEDRPKVEKILKELIEILPKEKYSEVDKLLYDLLTQNELKMSAIIYMTECQLSTISYMCVNKSKRKGKNEFARQIKLAQYGIDSIPTPLMSDCYFKDVLVKQVIRGHNKSVKEWIKDRYKISIDF